MFMTKKQHEAELQARLAEQAGRIAELEARLSVAEATVRLQKSENRLGAPSGFESPGEAAYQAAAEFSGAATDWANADQEIWEHAAYGAIAYGHQFAAENQIALFKAGARVPYYIDTNDGTNRVMSAQQGETVGEVLISVNGDYLRTILTNNALQWFTDFVTTPPGWVRL